MKKLTVFIIITLAMSGIGCSYEQVANIFVPKEEQEFATKYITRLRMNNFKYAKKHLLPELLTPDINTQLRKVSRYFPKGKPKRIELVGWNISRFGKKKYVNLTFQYEFKRKWVAANIIMSRVNGKLVVEGIHVNQLPQSLEIINAFTLREKSVVHYVFLVLSIIIPVFIIISLIVCIKTPMTRRKWLWIIFILFGFVSVSLNWTSGQILFQPISLYFLGAAAFASGKYAPWIISIAIPVGAIIFLLRRKIYLDQSMRDVMQGSSTNDNDNPDIIENEDGTFHVYGQTFKTKEDAEHFVNFARSLSR